MADINRRALDKLKCIQCDNYLSIYPILLKPDGTNVCGRCTVYEEVTHIRNTAYETLAETLVFPCRFEKDGCQKKLAWKDVKTHENETCDYRAIICALSICTWRGKPINMMNHIEEKHRDLYVSHPYNIKEDIMRNTEKTYIMSALNFTFLLQIKNDIATSNLSISVRYLGDLLFSSNFTYTFEASNSERMANDMKTVQSKNFSTKSDDCLLIDKTKLLKDFSYDNSDFIVQVKLKNPKCKNCNRFLSITGITFTKDGCYCKKCKKDMEHEKRICKHDKSGCKYIDIEMNVAKHEKYFCEFVQKCTEHMNVSNYFIHLVEAHDVSIKENLEQFIDIIPDKDDKIVLMKDNILLFCSYKYLDSSNSFEITILSNLPKSIAKDYICGIQTTNCTREVKFSFSNIKAETNNIATNRCGKVDGNNGKINNFGNTQPLPKPGGLTEALFGSSNTNEKYYDSGFRSFNKSNQKSIFTAPPSTSIHTTSTNIFSNVPTHVNTPVQSNTDSNIINKPLTFSNESIEYDWSGTIENDVNYPIVKMILKDSHVVYKLCLHLQFYRNPFPV